MHGRDSVFRPLLFNSILFHSVYTVLLLHFTHPTVRTAYRIIVRARSINFTVCVMRGQFEGALYSRARSINFTVCVMRGLFEGAVYSKGANYSRKYGIYLALSLEGNVFYGPASDHFCWGRTSFAYK